ncbi:MAG TPA: hypothetical protein VFA96_02680 [Nocardioides sp.]|nr:hypothetical protein [Nocardioides sp.]
MNVFANATLQEIRGPSPIDGYGNPTGQGPVLWAGSANGYLKRARRQRKQSGEADRGLTDTFTILRTALAGALEVAGPAWEATTVVIADQRTGTTIRRRFSVRGMENRAAGTIADSVRLELTGEGPAT